MPKNSMIKRKDGRYQYKVTDSFGKRKIITSYKGELRRDFAKRCDELDKEVATKANDITLDDIFYQWIGTIFPTKNTFDYESMTGAYERYIKDAFGSRELTSITRQELYKHLIQLRDKGYSYSVVEKAKGAFSRPLDWAINELGLEIDNVASNLTLPKQNGTKPEIRIYTKEDEERFFNAAKDSKYINYFRLLLYTGLRPSEALGLKWSDINDSYIYIERGITRKGLGPLKTKNAYRQVPISDAVREILEAQPKINDWLFPTNSGTPNMHGMKTTHKRIIKQTAVWEKVGRKYHGILITPPLEHTMYDFRHTYGTRMAEVGTPDYLLARLMGHSSASITKKYYIGITDKMMDSAFDFMDKI